MQAAYHATYGPADVLTLRDIPQPRIGATDVLVQVHASAVTTADWRLRASAFPGYAWLIGRLMFGLFAPRNNVLGSDFSGQVVAVGPMCAALPSAILCSALRARARMRNIWRFRRMLRLP